MYSFIDGKLSEITPAYVVLECNGIGFHINISLNTYQKINNLQTCKLFTYLSIKEDAHTLFGFAEVTERKLFLNLISVQGIGTNTARMMLSSMSIDEIEYAIINSDVKALQNIKGIGLKTAQRVIIELKDKIAKDLTNKDSILFNDDNNNIKEMALSALVTLGFSKNIAEKAINNVLKTNKEITTVEDLIKIVLKTQI
ncbi:MAG: Holliday junction DNA helicase RuvA [Bacteroidetes bacterium GWE2_29_8]|nr:MAG: Holliday junction DNA helicase RuvA [Bacteroidetes bacterium GWE2_29_8]OFY16482.1 MAG: Holliday junction DNA helicase RuvA [Bacteroidetes bacterium GWF2_29_10]